MPESYHEWLDRELVKDHEADPESFRQPIITELPPIAEKPNSPDGKL